MVIVTVECADPRPHDPHTWREGFLWHRKRICGGTPRVIDESAMTPNERRAMLGYCEADVEATAQVFEWLFRVEPEHRHYYGFSAEKSDPVLMVWECMDPFCDHEYTRFRSLFNYQTRVRRVLADGYSVRYAEDFYRSWR